MFNIKNNNNIKRPLTLKSVRQHPCSIFGLTIEWPPIKIKKIFPQALFSQPSPSSQVLLSQRLFSDGVLQHDKIRPLVIETNQRMLQQATNADVQHFLVGACWMGAGRAGYMISTPCMR